MGSPQWVTQVIEHLFPKTTPEGALELPFRIEYGEFTTPEARTYRIGFSKPYSKPPTVLCAGSVRAGRVAPPAPYKAPEVTPPAAISPATLSSVLLRSLTEMRPELAVPPSIQVPSVEPFRKVYDRIQSTFKTAEEKIRTGISDLGKHLQDIASIKSGIQAMYENWVHPNGPLCPSVSWSYDWGTVNLAGKRLFEYPGVGRADRTCLWYIVDNLTGRQIWSDEVSYAVQRNITFLKAVIGDAIAKPLENLRSSVEKLEASISKIRESLESFLSTVRDTIAGWGESIEAAKTEVQGKLDASLKGLGDKWTQLRDGMASVISRYNSEIQGAVNAFNTDVKRMTDAVGDRLMKQYSEIREGLGRISSQAYTSVTSAVKGLYQMTGVREGVLLVPVAISKVDASGFELEGVAGGKYWWMAIGPK